MDVYGTCNYSYWGLQTNLQLGAPSCTPSGYLTLLWKITFCFTGKPVNHRFLWAIYTMAMLNNQRVDVSTIIHSPLA